MKPEKNKGWSRRAGWLWHWTIELDFFMSVKMRLWGVRILLQWYWIVTRKCYVVLLCKEGVRVLSLHMYGKGLKTLRKQARELEVEWHRQGIIPEQKTKKKVTRLWSSLQSFFSSLSLKAQRQLRKSMLEKFDFEEVFVKEKNDMAWGKSKRILCCPDDRFILNFSAFLLGTVQLKSLNINEIPSVFPTPWWIPQEVLKEVRDSILPRWI